MKRCIMIEERKVQGGATFGHLGGAYSPEYSPMYTLNDYDAPVDGAVVFLRS